MHSVYPPLIYELVYSAAESRSVVSYALQFKVYSALK